MPRSCEGETQKFIDNCLSNPRFLLMLEVHASADLKCSWDCFLGNGCSILPRSLIAPKQLQETVNDITLAEAGGGNLCFIVDKVSG